MRILVMGYGVSGRGAALFLRAQGHEVVPVDKKGGEGVLLDSLDLDLAGFDQMILSPGIVREHPLVRKAKALGIEVIGELELGLRYLGDRKCFGVTGSNGKTTTVLLTAHILNESGIKARALGNVGESLSAYLLKGDPEEIAVIELSSFQLQMLCTRVFEAAIILNITPNHLDWHSSMEEYVRAKAQIQLCLKEEKELYISDQVRRDFGAFFLKASDFEKELVLLKGLSYTQLGMASKQSVQAAYLLCKRCGVTDTAFLRGLQSFKKPPHRIEWVAEIDGVSYYNDSKSSNVHSVLHAVDILEGPIVLIVGGLHKGSSYAPWIEKLNKKVRQIVAYGQAAPIMECELVSHFPFQKIERFADAVKWAKGAARKQEIVLLSPGCSSYDQFENYAQRGEEFKRLVKEL